MSHVLPLLHPRFHGLDHYHARSTTGYSLLPLRFLPLDAARYVVTNVVGEHVVLAKDVLRRFIRHELARDEAEYDELKSRHFLIEEGSTVALDLLATKYRTKQSFLSQFTSLFMFVTTLR